jgi:DNA-binding IclR family transcriptional regulator
VAGVKSNPVQGSQTLARGLRAVEIIAQAPDGMTGAEVARSMGAHQSIVYRLLQTLVQSGIVRRDSDNHYRIGLSTLQLANAATGGLRSVARPLLSSAADATRCSCWLFVENGDEAVAVLAVEPGAFRTSNPFVEGSRHPLNRGAAGYALLSLYPPSAADLPTVVEAREAGYAISHGEISPSAWGIAAPVRFDSPAMHACVTIASSSEVDVLAAVPVLHQVVRELAEAINRPGLPVS